MNINKYYNRRPSRMRRIKDRSASTTVFRIMLALIVLVFVLFYTVGYRHTDNDIPQFNAPLLTGVLVAVAILFVCGTLAMMLWSALRSHRKGMPFWKQKENGVPKGMITLVTFCAVFVLMQLTFGFGSSREIQINNQPYANVMWLKAANMFIVTAAVMLAVAIGAIVADWYMGRKNRGCVPSAENYGSADTEKYSTEKEKE